MKCPQYNASLADVSNWDSFNRLMLIKIVTQKLNRRHPRKTICSVPNLIVTTAFSRISLSVTHVIKK